MRSAWIFAIAVGLLLPAPLLAQTGDGQAAASPPTPLAEGSKAEPNAEDSSWETIIFPARYMSAERVAEILNALFESDEQVRISAQPEYNLVLLRVAGPRKPQVLDLLRQLDRKPEAITVRAYLVRAVRPLDEVARLSGPLAEVEKTLGELEADQRADVVRQLEVVALENETALLQVGERQPVVSGTTRSAAGQRLAVSRDISVGTLLSVVQRRVGEGQWIVDFKFEMSAIGEPRSADTAVAPANPAVLTLVHQATLELRQNQALLAQRFFRKNGGRESESYYLIVAAASRGEGQAGSISRAFSRQTRLPETPPPLVAEAATSPAVERTPIAAKVSDVGVGEEGGDGEEGEGLERGSLVDYALRSYDKNRSGVLEQSEWSSVKSGLGTADTDGDKVISRDELGRWIRQRFKTLRSAERNGENEKGTGRTDASGAGTDAGAGAAKPSRERYLLFSQALVKRYDANGDGRLSEAESSRMARRPEGADADGDGYITAEELADALQK